MFYDDEVVQFPIRLFPPDDPPGIEVFREWAAHEAAHAVVTTGLGIKMHRILVVQLTGDQKLGYARASPEEDQEDCSSSTPDRYEYKNTTPGNQCLIARAGEIGQRLHLRDKGGTHAAQGRKLVDPEHWKKDRDDIKDIVEERAGRTLSNDELTTFLEALGAPIEAWLQEEEPQKVLKNLTEYLVQTSKPWPNDPTRARRELKGDELLEQLKDTPAFPADQISPMPGPTAEPEKLPRSGRITRLLSDMDGGS